MLNSLEILFLSIYKSSTTILLWKFITKRINTKYLYFNKTMLLKVKKKRTSLCSYNFMTHQGKNTSKRKTGSNLSKVLNYLVFSFKYHLRRFNMASNFNLSNLPSFQPGSIFIQSQHTLRKQFTIPQTSLNIYTIAHISRSFLGIQQQFL